jgi:argininosuccinate synthase
MKSRGVYETPGGTILYEAHKALEQICIERDTLHYKQQIALRYAELVYNGQWFHPLREALQAFIDHTNSTVSGIAKVRLFKGRAMQSATSPIRSRPEAGDFSMEGDVTAARFIHLFGLPMKVASQHKKRW